MRMLERAAEVQLGHDRKLVRTQAGRTLVLLTLFSLPEPTQYALQSLAAPNFKQLR